MAMRHVWIALGISFLLFGCGSSSDRTDAGQDAGDSGVEDANDGGADTSGDAYSDVLDQCSAGLQPTGPWGFIVIQDLVTEDDTIRIRIVLKPGDDATVGETIPYHLIRLALISSTDSFCIDQTSQLDYEWGHHNWDEIGRARHADVEYIFRMVLSVIGPNGWEDSLEAKSLSSGGTLWGPLNMVDAGCRTVPPGNRNACIFRERLDR